MRGMTTGDIALGICAAITLGLYGAGLLAMALALGALNLGLFFLRNVRE